MFDQNYAIHAGHVYHYHYQHHRLTTPLEIIAGEFAQDLISDASAGGRASRARVHIKLLCEPARLVLSKHVAGKILKRGNLSLIKEYISILPRRAADMERLKWRNELVYKSERENFSKQAKDFLKETKKMTVAAIKTELLSGAKGLQVVTKVKLAEKLAKERHCKLLYQQREEAFSKDTEMMNKVMEERQQYMSSGSSSSSSSSTITHKKKKKETCGSCKFCFICWRERWKS
jgi:hypothetical protein